MGWGSRLWCWRRGRRQGCRLRYGRWLSWCNQRSRTSNTELACWLISFAAFGTFPHENHRWPQLGQVSICVIPDNVFLLRHSSLDSEYFTLNTPKPIHTQHNGVETLIVESGDFVLFEPHEAHYVITEDRDIKVFKVKYIK